LDAGYYSNPCWLDSLFGCILRYTDIGWSRVWNPNPVTLNWDAPPLRLESLDQYDGPAKDRMAGVVQASLDGFTLDRSSEWLAPWLIADPTVLLGANNASPHWFYKQLIHTGGTKLADDLIPNPDPNWRGGYRKPDSWNQRWEGSDSTQLMAAFTTIFIWLPFVGNVNIPIPYWSGDWGGTGGLFGKDSEGSASAGPLTGDVSPFPSIMPFNIFNPTQRQTALRKYRDVANIEQATSTQNRNLTSPPLLVEVERDAMTVSTSATSNSQLAGRANLSIGRGGNSLEPVTGAGCTAGRIARNAPRVATAFGVGNFDVGNGVAGSCMRAMAKAEAYFSRPSGLYPREDGMAEYGSLYSPYWQARLVPTTAAEQTASMILHRLTAFTGTNAGASAASTRLVNATP
jgi:hypothetical protein